MFKRIKFQKKSNKVFSKARLTSISSLSSLVLSIVLRKSEVMGGHELGSGPVLPLPAN